MTRNIEIDANAPNIDGLSVGDKVHTFERAGLGRAPFYFIGMSHEVFVAAPGAPAQAGGSCDYCGEAISFHFHIRSSDGKRFKVGCNCVAKTGDAGLRKVVDAAMAKARREADHKRQDAKISEVRAMLARSDVRAALAAKPHPSENAAKFGRTLADWCDWMMGPNGAGRAGRVKVWQVVAKVAERLEK